MDRRHSTPERPSAPQTPIESVREILNRVEDPESFHTKLVSLDNHFRETQFGGSLLRHAIRVGAILRYTEQQTIDHSKPAFYSGELVGLAACLNILNETDRFNVINCSFDYAPQRQRREDAGMYARRTAAFILDGIDTVDDAYQRLADRDQLALDAISIYGCKGLGLEDQQTQFTRGILFTQTQVEKILGRRFVTR
jgi:hypothetical protein